VRFGILVDRLADGPVDRLKLGGEMIDCRGGQLGRGGVAETAADAILPLRPAEKCRKADLQTKPARRRAAAPNTLS